MQQPATHAPTAVRVNGTMLPQFVTKTVMVPGKVIAPSNGQHLTLQAADGAQILVHVNQAVSPSAHFIEVTGVAEPDGSVRMVSFAEFPDTVDMALLNDAIQLQFTHSHLFMDG
ncbi:hypothetical protein GGF31_004100 [Allomyces arbusculus]|nr:hypothetical protein GGF31_004100 [Allomyces arbusculus]